MNAPPRRRFVGAGAVLAVAAALCLSASARIAGAGRWLPEPPVAIGAWEATSIALSGEARSAMGNPPTIGREYRNPLDERITVHLIGPSSFDAYREPPVLHQYYQIAAQRDLPLFGPDARVRAMVWKGRYDPNVRLIMYAWIQESDGGTRLFEPGGLQSFSRRLGIGSAAALRGRDSCIVRLTAEILETDPTGAQTRRNLDEVARGLRAAIVAQAGERR